MTAVRSEPGWEFPARPIDWTTRRLGTIVPDVDLEHCTDEMFARIGSALLTHSVIVMQEQQLSPQRQLAFTRRFGEISVSMHRDYRVDGMPEVTRMSNLLVDGKRIGHVAIENGWHSDFLTFERPALVTMLFAVELPRAGGDTLFADMYAAYDALTPQRRRELDATRVMHRYLPRYRLTSEEMAKANVSQCVHPLVRTIPQTGRRALYPGEKGSAFATGMPEPQGDAFIREVVDRATEPQFVYAHTWTVGEVVIWDNRTVLHCATPFDTENDRRILHRTSSVGERPYFA